MGFLDGCTALRNYDSVRCHRCDGSASMWLVGRKKDRERGARNRKNGRKYQLGGPQSDKFCIGLLRLLKRRPQWLQTVQL